MRVVLFVTMMAGALIFGVVGTAPWMNANDGPDERAAQLMAHMSLDDKIQLLHGENHDYTGSVGPGPAASAVCAWGGPGGGGG